MGTTFHGPSPWPHITRVIRTRGTRHAAIAHLGQDAPTLLPLRAGDVLVVNASRAAVRAHLTSPVALAYYRDAGVRVLSSPDLHANVIATE
ncbi:phosphatidylserine/phosphatidylglycerophosphate/cardiolipin synthase family protein, partial [Rhodococcus sp. T2V]|nr:phosphatidylserine/phosphatidylglycerophosphate/cardiolipin synthase family protein [Rhodococcus sp. T2V]